MKNQCSGFTSNSATTWPWPSTTYDLTSPEFELVAGEVSLAWDGASLSGALDAPAAGFRLVDMEGSSQGANPVRGATITAIHPDAESPLTPTTETISGGRTVWTFGPDDLSGAVAISVEDEYGNAGWIDLD